ncbi:glycosyltransferase [Larkinella harenae]
MRILHVISGLDPKIGGTSQALKTIIEGLSQRAVVNEVVCLADPEADYLRELPFPVYATGPAKTPWQYSPALWTWLKAHLHQYDAVVVHGLWHYHTYAVYNVWNELKTEKPMLYVMPHGMLDPWFQRATGRRLKALRNRFFWRFAERRIVNSADGLLFTSETEKRLAREPFKPYAPKSEKVVGLGVENPPVFTAGMQEAFLQKCPGLTGPFLLFISRIHVKKGVDLLVKAYLRLKAEGVNLPQLVIAGPELETPFGQDVVTLAAADQNILFPGMLSGDAKWGAFYSSEAFVLPSHQENFGIAVVEALACGKPVLISNQVNIWREIVQENAGLVEKDTEEGAYQLLKQWVSRTTLQKERMSERARRTFDHYFTVSQAAENMVSVFSQSTPITN